MLDRIHAGSRTASAAACGWASPSMAADLQAKNTQDTSLCFRLDIAGVQRIKIFESIVSPVFNKRQRINISTVSTFLLFSSPAGDDSERPATGDHAALHARASVPSQIQKLHATFVTGRIRFANMAQHAQNIGIAIMAQGLAVARPPRR